MLNATELAKTLNVSQARVSQYVSQGKLSGCFTGDGRSRRFDLEKVCTALGRKLDLGQMLGNGAKTRAALSRLAQPDDAPEQKAAPPPPHLSPQQRDGTELPANDTARYEMARTQKAEEEARRLRRMNQEAEGRYVLAEEVDRQVQKVVAQEVAEMDAVIRNGARAVADKMGVDVRVVRQILTETWRAHRNDRSEVLTATSDATVLTETEQAEDI